MMQVNNYGHRETERDIALVADSHEHEGDFVHTTVRKPVYGVITYAPPSSCFTLGIAAHPSCS